MVEASGGRGRHVKNECFLSALGGVVVEDMAHDVVRFCVRENWVIAKAMEVAETLFCLLGKWLA